jgi:hypothetical protein
VHNRLDVPLWEGVSGPEVAVMYWKALLLKRTPPVSVMYGATASSAAILRALSLTLSLAVKKRIAT